MITPPFVCLSQIGILRRWLKRRITQTTPYGSPGTRFLLLKISAKFQRVSPKQGRQIEVGQVTIGDF